MWNGFSMISKQPELTEGMMQTLMEAERTLQDSPGEANTAPQQTSHSLREVQIIQHLPTLLQKMSIQLTIAA